MLGSQWSLIGRMLVKCCPIVGAVCNEGGRGEREIHLLFTLFPVFIYLFLTRPHLNNFIVMFFTQKTRFTQQTRFTQRIHTRITQRTKRKRK